jgi:two-component system cell cycle response regulator
MSMSILIIEDNSTNLDLLSFLLRACGYTPVPASTGEEGLMLVRLEPVKLIICDIQLPGIDGCEVARRIKADPALRHIPLLAVTALAMVGDRDRILSAGFDGYISKPIDPETFVPRIKVFMDRPARTGVPETPAASGLAAMNGVQRPAE